MLNEDDQTNVDVQNEDLEESDESDSEDQARSVDSDTDHEISDDEDTEEPEQEDNNFFDGTQWRKEPFPMSKTRLHNILMKLPGVKLSYVGTIRKNKRELPSNFVMVEEKHKLVKKKWDKEKLEKEKEKKTYENAINNLLQKENKKESLEEEWNTIKRIITKSAEKVIGTKRVKSRNGWFDEECEKIIMRKREARINWIRTCKQEHYENYKRIKKEVAKLMTEKKRDIKYSYVMNFNEMLLIVAALAKVFTIKNKTYQIT
ncbi:hypothetical protein RN001_001106 [Aquatica leii]|uniref:Uncharacterized protein n=1 Tax=Aquatica leii TaxID=1421715 RepID=A0AAN7SSK5_9COLE|nr:hypothetical protein RN001_001106 [Aquatica leii]